MSEKKLEEFIEFVARNSVTKISREIREQGITHMQLQISLLKVMQNDF